MNKYDAIFNHDTWQTIAMVAHILLTLNLYNTNI